MYEMATFVSFSQSLKNILMQLERRLDDGFMTLKIIGPQCVLLSKKTEEVNHDKSMKMLNVELGNEFSHARVMLNTSYFTK